MTKRGSRSLTADRRLRAHVIGVAIGDGNLSNPNGRAVRLRITCGTKYPVLIAKIQSSLERLLPANKVTLVRGNGNFVNLSVYSNRLEPLLGWKALGGSKSLQQVTVPLWIFKSRSASIACLRGLIETDGAVYQDRGYPMAIFSSVIPELARQVLLMMHALGFRPHFYKLRRHPNRSAFKYHVRLSRDVLQFLRVVKPVKA